MNTRVLLDSAISEVVNRYRGYAARQNSIYLGAIMQTDLPMASLYLRLRSDAEEISYRAQIDMMNFIIDQFIGIASHIDTQSIFDTDIDIDASLLLTLQNELVMRLMSNSEQQIKRDAQAVRNSFLRFMTEVETKAPRMGERNARISARESYMAFGAKYIDKLGRKWDADRYLTVETTHAFYHLVNMVRLHEMITSGATRALIVKPKETIEIDLEDYVYLEAKHFFPGSHALLEPMVN